jgi:hypothetical protein
MEHYFIVLPFIKGRRIRVSPFGKGGLRGILIPLGEIFP